MSESDPKLDADVGTESGTEPATAVAGEPGAEAGDKPRAKRRWWRRWDWKSWLLAACGSVFLAWFLIWGPVGLAEVPANPTFCIRLCHNMQPQYDTWSVSAHNSQICGDCHLPQEPVSRLLWEGYFGARDLWKFYVVGSWEEPIKAKPRTHTFLQDNCMRCHGVMAKVAESSERYCWDCHRGITHRGQDWKTEQAQRRTDDPRN